MNRILIVLSILCSMGCGKRLNQHQQPLAPISVAGDDDSVVHGRAIVEINTDHTTFLTTLFSLFPKAFAVSSGSSVVAYTNAPSTNFTINVAALTAGTFTGNTLSLGHVDLATLSDNHLKVCNPGGNTKCTQAIIRIYTTGATAGFLHTVDGYGLPVYAGSLNPLVPVGLNAAGAVQTQLYTIPPSTNKLTMTNFPTPVYGVTSDFSNAGSGSYSMTLVVEYALSP